MITVILTCYNRCEKTINCIKSLVSGNSSIVFKFVVVDDKSSDNTIIELRKLSEENVDITILSGTGHSYWSGGMRLGIKYAQNSMDSDYYMLINDDVIFFEHTIEKMCQQEESISGILVGAMCDHNGELSYGGIRYTGKSVSYKTIGPKDYSRICDTFNANCVLISHDFFFRLPNIDTVYIHSLGDFDYGLTAKRLGIVSNVTNFYVGECVDNAIRGTWLDTNLSIWERLKHKESVKGAPFSCWYYYLRKNFGLKKAIIHSITPYIRILLGG